MVTFRSLSRTLTVVALLASSLVMAPLGHTAGAASTDGAASTSADGADSSPTAPATISPDDPRVGRVVDGLSLEQKIGQILWTHVYGTSAGDTTYAQANNAVFGEGIDTPGQAVEKYGLGGVIYFNWSHNVESPTQLASLSSGLQQAAQQAQQAAQQSGDSADYAPDPTQHDSTPQTDDTPSPQLPVRLPLAIGMDQEGGLVARVRDGATDWPGAMALGATRNADLSYRQGVALGEEIGAMGVNVDFAPVMDVNTNAANPVIGVRSFGDDPSAVGAFGVAQINGLQGEGIAATAKHFPGHGDTHNDSHLALPRVSYDRDTLDQHLTPFRAAITAGVDMVMTAHVVVDAVDPTTPATLSSKVLTGLLREELGYKGLIVTDALDMEGAELSVLTPDQQKQYREYKVDRQRMIEEAGVDPTRAAQAAANPTPEYRAFMAPIRGEVALRSLQAGADVLVNTYDPQAIVDRIKAALRSGELTQQRLDDAVSHVVAWKFTRLGDASEQEGGEASSSVAGDLSTVGSAEHRALASEIAHKSVTMLRNTAVPSSQPNEATPVDPLRLAGGVRGSSAGLVPSEGILPLSPERYPSVAVIGPSYANPEFIEEALAAQGFRVTRDSVRSTAAMTEQELEQALEHAQHADMVIVTSLSVTPDSAQAALMRRIAELGKPWIVVGARTPYDLANYAASQGMTEELLPTAALMLYSNRRVSYEAAVNVMLGAAPQGTLPAAVPWTPAATTSTGSPTELPVNTSADLAPASKPTTAQPTLAFARGFGLTYTAASTSPTPQSVLRTSVASSDIASDASGAEVLPEGSANTQPSHVGTNASQAHSPEVLARTGALSIMWLVTALSLVMVGVIAIYVRRVCTQR